MKNKNEMEDPVLFDVTAYNKLQNLFKDGFAEFLNEHIENSRNSIRQIKEAIVQRDAKTLERCAHSLKGATAQFGANKLSAIAYKIEKYGSEAEFGKADELLASLCEAQQQAADIMLKHINKQ